MLYCVGSSSVVSPVALGILIVYFMRWIHSCLRVCRITSILLTVPWHQKHWIITAGLGVSMSTGPSTILFDVGLWFYFIVLRTDV